MQDKEHDKIDRLKGEIADAQHQIHLRGKKKQRESLISHRPNEGNVSLSEKAGGRPTKTTNEMAEWF